MCVCVCICVNDEKLREREREKCNLIFEHLECLASAPFSLKGREWQAGEHTWSPAAPRARRRIHTHTHTHLLHFQACSNASLKAPTVKGQASLVSLLQGCEVLTVAHYGDKLRPRVWCVSRRHRWMFQNTQRII